MSENEEEAVTVDATPILVQIFGRVATQLQERLEAPLSENDATAINSAIARASTEGFKEGARSVAEVVEDNVTVAQLKVSMDALPVVDPWEKEYGTA